MLMLKYTGRMSNKCTTFTQVRKDRCTFHNYTKIYCLKKGSGIWPVLTKRIECSLYNIVVKLYKTPFHKFAVQQYDEITTPTQSPPVFHQVHVTKSCKNKHEGSVHVSI